MSGKMPDDVGASFQFPVQAFDRVVRPDLGPVRWREPGVGEQVGFHAREAAGDAGCGGLELIDDGSQLGDGGVVVGLDEDRADQRRDQLTLLMGCGRQHVAHRVDAAALPGGALEASGRST